MESCHKSSQCSFPDKCLMDLKLHVGSSSVLGGVFLFRFIYLLFVLGKLTGRIAEVV
ncbi:hypothetical protein GDO86_015493 [Hymenochirus boettgeri]|uniref:Uncharacterized protein n=1 Tax=Hymenochirus boettgeri TaxID=247094 RepID=A0A8T2JZ09_9PIPI|nr:hypothetical protein GDO86_015493 [Hymenochirus boettgeri]